jgi:hypothetical protein
MRFRRTRAVIVSREAAKQTKGANGAAPSGRAYVKARQGSEGRPSRLDRHVALARRKTGVFRCILPLCPGFEVRSINSERRLTWRTHPLILRSEAKSRVSKDAPEGGARTGAHSSIPSTGSGQALRGRFAVPQDDGVGMKCTELQNRDTGARCVSMEPSL